MKNIAIIYHDADFDGKLSNEVCRFHLQRLHPDATIHSYGWDYGRPAPQPMKIQQGHTTVDGLQWTDYDAIYIVDLSVDELMARPELRDRIVWIDHHKSAIEKWDVPVPFDGEHHPDNPVGTQPMFKGSRIDGVAACRLCWQWFTWGKLPKGVLPSKQDYIEPLTKQLFVDRLVKEPELIRLAGEYDVWDHRDPDGKALQFGLRSLDNSQFAALVEGQFTGREFLRLDGVIAEGRAIKAYCDAQNDEYAKAHAHTIKFKGLTFCALNIGQRGNSDLLRAAVKPEHDALFAWRWTGDAVSVSLYHAPGKEHHDLSKIALYYKGGGHQGACGFKLNLQELGHVLHNRWAE